MTNLSLSRQLSLLVAGTVIAFSAVLWITLLSISATMNDRAAAETFRLMEGRISALQDQLGLIASDYHNWTDIYVASRDQNFALLSSNYGITAKRGDVFQFAELFDGPFTSPISWRAGFGHAHQPGFLEGETLVFLRQAVRTLEVQNRQTFNYFDIISGELVTFSASYLLPEAQELLEKVSIPKETPIAVIGKIIESSVLNRISEEIGVSQIHVSTSEPTEGEVALPLLGANGTVAAYLAWHPSSPGSEMMKILMPLMGLVNLSFLGAAIFANRILSKNARVLVDREIETARQARRDPLTGLPNRLALLEHLTETSNASHFEYAVLTIDLDRFKQVNDSVGHHNGDIFLVEFSRQLSVLIEPGIFLSRSGGDEFFVVMRSEKNLTPLINRVTSALEDLSTTRIYCGAAAFEILAAKGLARSGACRDAKEIMRRADRAMYNAKRNNEQKVMHYNKALAIEDARRRDVDSALREACLNASQFKIVYQPIVAISDLGTPIQYEALLRWHSPELGDVSPEEILQVAEETGQIVALGWIIFDIICKDLAANPSLHVSMNVSPIQLLHPGFTAGVLDRLLDQKISPSRLQVEITENVVFENYKIVARELFLLRRSGITIALDDFGTGFSSIGYLAKMPFDTLKIDRKYVIKNSVNSSDLFMVKSIIGIGKALDLVVVAEGVEDLVSAEILKQLGCTQLQGFFIGRPAPLEHFRKLNVELSRCHL